MTRPFAVHVRSLPSAAFLCVLLAGAAWCQAGEAPWALGETRSIRNLGANRGVRIEVTSAALLDRYGDTAAAPGQRFIVLRTRWENTFPLTLIEGKDVPTEYRIP